MLPKSMTDFLELCLSGSALEVHDAIQAGADIHARNSEGESPLMLAAASQSPEKIRLLLDAGADVNAAQNNGVTALMMATSYEHTPEATAALLAAGADVNARTIGGATPLLYYCLFCATPDHIRLLLDAGSEVKAVPVLSAVCYGGLKAEDEMRIVSMLLEAGAEVNTFSHESKETPLAKAVARGLPEVVSMLLDAGADINLRADDCFSSLEWAVDSYYPEIVSLLLDAGADIHARNAIGDTPLLHYCVSSASPDHIRILLDAGSDVKATNCNGMSALTALDYDSLPPDSALSIVSMLLAAGAEVNTFFSQRSTQSPLACAASRAQPAVVALLLKAGADINAKPEGGFSPLEWTVANNESPEVADMLFDAGAEYDKETLLDFAKHNQNPEMLATVQKRIKSA